MGVRVCPCLGTLGSKLPLPPAVVDGLLGGFVVYCAVGSVCLLLLRRFPEWRERLRALALDAGLLNAAAGEGDGERPQ